MTLARCLPACNAPLRLEIEPAVTMPLTGNWETEIILRPARIVVRCDGCGRLREFHSVIAEVEA